MMVKLLLSLIVLMTTHSVYSAEANPVSGERLLANPPSGWQQIYSLNTEKTRLVDYVPGNETEDEWKTKISFESHQSLVDVDPISILMGELDATRQNCENIESFNLYSGVENNYPTSVRLTFCGENAHTGEGEVTISKAIQANDYLYLIKLLHRVPAFTSNDNNVSEQQIASWADYFGKLSVCDDRDEAHPCNTPAESAAEPAQR